MESINWDNVNLPAKFLRRFQKEIQTLINKPPEGIKFIKNLKEEEIDKRLKEEKKVVEEIKEKPETIEKKEITEKKEKLETKDDKGEATDNKKESNNNLYKILSSRMDKFEKILKELTKKIYSIKENNKDNEENKINNESLKKQDEKKFSRRKRKD